MSKKNETKKLNKLAVKKETISDLNVKNADDVKGGATFTNTCGATCKTQSIHPACPSGIGCIKAR
ncbi:MAG TPA: class I lanthipeptide [Blastocatellia bacterium]